MSIGLATKGVLSDGIGDGGVTERIYVLELGVSVEMDEPEIVVSADDLDLAVDFQEPEVKVEIPETEKLEALESTVEVEL
jgi:hypothetical protein